MAEPTIGFRSDNNINKKAGYEIHILPGSESGTRTRVSTVRGWRANRYTNSPFYFDIAKVDIIFDSRNSSAKKKL